MSLAITIGRAGRVVVPKAVRERLHLREGDRMDMEVVGGVIHLRPSDDEAELVEEDGLLVISAKGKPKGKPGAIRAAIKADREERIKKLSGFYRS